MRRVVLSFVLASALGAIALAAQSQVPAGAVATAAEHGDRDAVRALLKQGADASAPQGDGMTALHWAADRGDAAMADMLIYAGANVSAVTRLGQYTPLHLASRSGSDGLPSIASRRSPTRPARRAWSRVVIGQSSPGSAPLSPGPRSRCRTTRGFDPSKAQM